MVKGTSIWVNILAFILTSCATIKDTPNEQLIKLEKGDYKKLNGIYSNYPTVASGTIARDMVSKDFEPESLWSQISGFREVGDKESFRKQTVSLEFISDRKAIATLWETTDLQKSKKIRGRFKEGYFYRSPYFVVLPLVPLFFWIQNFQVQNRFSRRFNHG